MAQIQAIDDYEREFGMDTLHHEVAIGIECRTVALATIRERLAGLAVNELPRKLWSTVV